MISSAGQVSPHVPVCFGTRAAPLTSLNSCKFGAKSCPLLHESARQPSPLPHHGSLMLRPGWMPAQHSWVPGWGGPTRVLIFHKLACEHDTGSLANPSLHAPSSASQTISGVAGFQGIFPCLSPLLLELSDFVITAASTKNKSKVLGVQM